jgi:cbb3-type cytochrome oxidase maturation protein
MDIMLYMIPVALITGLAWLFVFLWSMKNGQLDDLDGASHRALFAEDDRDARPLPAVQRIASQEKKS